MPSKKLKINNLISFQVTESQLQTIWKMKIADPMHLKVLLNLSSKYCKKSQEHIRGNSFE